MAVEIVMPKLSDTMEEGRILKWLKKEGDFVSKGDVIAEVETDKADMDLEVFSSGVITEIRYQEGDTVAVGTVIALLGGDSKKDAPQGKKEDALKVTREMPAAVADSDTEPKESEGGVEGEEPCCTVMPEEEEKKGERPKKESPPRAKEGEKPKVSPAARRLVKDERIDVGELKGSGPGGRIVKEDVENYLEARAKRKRTEKEAPAAEVAPAVSGRQDQVVELSKMRATIARRMTQSKQTIPHFYVTRDVDMGEADRFIESLNKMEGDDGKITYNDVVIKACALALREYPELNAHLTEKGLVQKGDINIGVVVALRVGLLVPVLRNTDKLTLKEISSTVKGLRDRVVKRESTPDDLTGGTFTVSNMGMFGVDEFSAIINPPQVAILAVSAVKDVPVIRGSRIHPAKVMKITLSADHRAVDGVIVARFLQKVKDLLENPVALIL